jgi:Tannase and feruloyl esterase
MVFGDSTFDLHALRFDRDPGAKLRPLINSDNPDLQAFAARGGKLLQFHGWNGQVIAPRDSIAYYNAVTAKLGDPAKFYRLFMILGMLHCEGGRGPASLPTLDAIETWVEAGRAPRSAERTGMDALPLSEARSLLNRCGKFGYTRSRPNREALRSSSSALHRVLQLVSRRGTARPQ